MVSVIMHARTTALSGRMGNAEEGCFSEDVGSRMELPGKRLRLATERKLC